MCVAWDENEHEEFIMSRVEKKMHQYSVSPRCENKFGAVTEGEIFFVSRHT
jgi:hypothetical protein